MKPLRALLFIAAFVCSVFAQDPGKIFVVRHAEKESQAKDAALSDVGRARATCLASTLRDSGITRIFVSEFQRTQKTANPLAELAKLPPTVIAAADTASLIAAAKNATASGNVLIVAHSNTIPVILERLGVRKVGVPDDEFDRLFIVTVGPSPSLATIRYCPSSPK
jgi:broad specificity phosphatase PhoE